MTRFVRTLLFAVPLVWFAGAAQANDLEGEIEAVDTAEQTFTVQGITFHTKDKTDYKDGLKGFDDLEAGQRVEVDFKFRDGRHYATEVELDD